MKLAEKENCCLFCKNKFEEKPTVVYPKGLENIELLRRTMILSCKKRFEKSHELDRLYWYMLIVVNESQINEKVLIHNLQTIKC